MASRQLERTAYHEAGHAVIAAHVPERFRYVTITPDGDALGHVKNWAFSRRFQPDAHVSPRGREIIDNRVMTLFAGGIAEKRFSGRLNRVGAQSDHEQAVDLADYLSGNTACTEAYLKWRWVVAETAVEHHWADIERVAGALLERNRLTWREVRELIFGGRGR